MCLLGGVVCCVLFVGCSLSSLLVLRRSCVVRCSFSLCLVVDCGLLSPLSCRLFVGCWSLGVMLVLCVFRCLLCIAC